MNEVRLFHKSQHTMNPVDYDQYLRSNSEWFRGYNPESPDAILQAEKRLGVTFPESLTWLLTQYGYWRATGVSALPHLVGTTLANRQQFPEHWLILGQPGVRLTVSDSSVSNRKRFQKETIILILSNQHRWDGKAVFHCDTHGEIIGQYRGFTEYTVANQHYFTKNSAAEYRNCLPMFHQLHAESLPWEEDSFNLEEFYRRLLETILFYDLYLKKNDKTTNALPSVISVEQTNFSTPLPRRYSEGWKELPQEISTSNLEFGVQNQPKILESGFPISTPISIFSDKPSTDIVAEIIESRRDYLHQHQHRIPACYQDNSSSPRHHLRLLSENAKGHLLIVEATTEREEFGITREQIVSLIHSANPSQNQSWLVSWLADSQVAQVCDRLESAPEKPCYRIVSPAEPASLASELKKWPQR